MLLVRFRCYDHWSGIRCVFIQWVKNAQSHRHIPAVLPLVHDTGVGGAHCIQHSWQLPPSKQVDTNDVHSEPTTNKPQAENGLLKNVSILLNQGLFLFRRWSAFLAFQMRVSQCRQNQSLFPCIFLQRTEQCRS